MEFHSIRRNDPLRWTTIWATYEITFASSDAGSKSLKKGIFVKYTSITKYFQCAFQIWGELISFVWFWKYSKAKTWKSKSSLLVNRHCSAISHVLLEVLLKGMTIHYPYWMNSVFPDNYIRFDFVHLKYSWVIFNTRLFVISIASF